MAKTKNGVNCATRFNVRLKRQKNKNKKKKVPKSTKMNLKLDVPGVDDGVGKGKANTINGMFTNVSAGIPSLNYA